MDNDNLYNLLLTCGLNCDLISRVHGETNDHDAYLIIKHINNVNDFDIELKRIFSILKREGIIYNSKFSEIKKSELIISLYIPYQETKHQFLFDINKE
jgi:hypothetical protein